MGSNSNCWRLELDDGDYWDFSSKEKAELMISNVIFEYPEIEGTFTIRILTLQECQEAYFNELS